MCPVRVTLTVNKRSCPVIHEFVTACRTEPKEAMVKRAREIFAEEGDADVSLVLSHAKRRKICVEVNERLAPPDALVLEGTDTPMRIYPGLVLRVRRQPSPEACATACSTRSYKLATRPFP